jgi:hypothetical protein
LLGEWAVGGECGGAMEGQATSKWAADANPGLIILVVRQRDPRIAITDTL